VNQELQNYKQLATNQLASISNSNHFKLRYLISIQQDFLHFCFFFQLYKDYYNFPNATDGQHLLTVDGLLKRNS